MTFYLYKGNKIGKKGAELIGNVLMANTTLSDLYLGGKLLNIKYIYLIIYLIFFN